MTSDSAPDPESTLDRETLEHIVGRPLEQEWPASALAPGSRVRVLRDPAWDGPWQREFLGTIDDLAAPAPVQHAQARHGELAYWICFDEPQFDSGGEGPYRKALIWDRYLRFEPSTAA
ncbi:hypothetical protein ABIA33_007674 [Streptacidiphilus sp. MAP12-16]|uniref:ferrous iron transport protein A n=1 Tax=Streptacidiphilus sp. MAP12-16 TaxID=3156300 RepID=UPI003511E2F6